MGKRIDEIVVGTPEGMKKSESGEISDTTASRSSIEENLSVEKINSEINSIIPRIVAMPDITSVSINSSSNVQIGNRVIYNGNVVISQTVPVVVERKTEIQTRFPRKIIIYSLLAILLVLLTVFVIIFTKNSLKNKQNPLKKLLEVKNLTIISRKEWGARNVSYEVEKLNLPLSLVVIHHTVTANCFSKENCFRILREIQDLHINSASIGDDIGYNFVVGNDGNVYEGRGWDDLGAFLYGFNRKSFGVAFIGDFRYNPPEDDQMAAGLLLFEEGVRLGKLTQNYKIYAARQLQATESPGKPFFDIIQTWDHWGKF